MVLVCIRSAEKACVPASFGASGEERSYAEAGCEVGKAAGRAVGWGVLHEKGVEVLAAESASFSTLSLAIWSSRLAIFWLASIL